LLKFIGSLEVSGPPEFSVSAQGFAIKSARIELSKNFNRAFNGTKKVPLENKIICAWELVPPEGKKARASDMLELFPDQPPLIEPGHLKEVLAAQIRGSSILLNEGPLGSFCLMRNAGALPQTVFLGRMAPAVWALEAPTAVGGSLGVEFRPGSRFLSC
jgi:hypothetical protein